MSASLTTSGWSGGESERKMVDYQSTVAIDLDSQLENLTPAPNADTPQSSTFNAVLGEHRRQGKDGEDSEHDVDPQKRMSRAPEHRIRMFVIRLVLIEKAASLLGKVAFLWATVVILGGFASTVNLTDFLVVTMIILAESTRVFSRSHELEWQAMYATGPHPVPKIVRLFSGHFRKPNLRLENASQNFTKQRTSSTPSKSEIGKQGSLSPNSPSGMRTPTYSLNSISRFNRAVMVRRVLYVAQLGSATVSIGLSLWRLSSQNYSSSSGSTGSSNVTVSMNVFYVLAVLEAGLFLLQRCYWEYEIRFRKLLEVVCQEDAVGIDNFDIVRNFFQDVFVKCLRGSLMDGLEMDLVSFSISWLQSEDFKRQWAGAQLLNRFVSKNDKLRMNDRFASDALNRLGTIPGIIERLVEKLCWGSEFDVQLRYEIASILCRLLVYSRNSRFLAVPSSMDAVISLFASSTDHVALQNHPFALRLSGLRILKYICKDRRNCLKIGETKGLLTILTGFIDVRGASSFQVSQNVPPLVLQGKIKTYKKTLQVLLLLASATNSSGNELWRATAAVVSELKFFRDIIEFGDNQPELQRLSIEILCHFAVENDLIGATGGLLYNLLKLFANYDEVHGSASGRTESSDNAKLRKMKTSVSVKAGEALARLVLQSYRNTDRLLALKNEVQSTGNKKPLVFVDVMVESLHKPDKLSSSAAQILRSTMMYADYSTTERIAAGSIEVIAKRVLKATGPSIESQMYEAILGLASCALRPLDAPLYWEVLTHVNKQYLVHQLMKNLQHIPAADEYPRIRRYSVELVLALFEKDDSFLDTFHTVNLVLRGWLQKTLDSVSEVENFGLFSGNVGYARFTEDMESLVQRAITTVDCIHSRQMYSP